MLFNYKKEMHFLSHIATFYLFDAFIFCNTNCEDYCIVTRMRSPVKLFYRKVPKNGSF